MELDVGNLVESWTENLNENWVKNWTDSYEQGIDCENLVYSAHDCSDSMKNWDNFSIPDCKFWSMDCYSVWQMLHSCCQVTFVELGKLDTLRRHGSVHDNKCNLDLSSRMGDRQPKVHIYHHIYHHVSLLILL